MDKYLKTAISIAKTNGKIFKLYFGKPKKISAKNHNPRDLVTEIDNKIEQQIRKTVLVKFPNHKIIGEELGSAKIKDNDFVWIIDPIDGTTNYIRGLPFCCISIALWDRRGPMVGVVYNPILKMMFTAERNHGAYLNGKRIQVSKERKYFHAFGGFGWGRDLAIAAKNFPLVLKRVKKIRTLGSAALETCLVAKGVYDFLIHKRLNIWDFAAAALIVTEAGGKVTDGKGRKITLQTDNLIASNGKIHNEILKKLR